MCDGEDDCRNGEDEIKEHCSSKFSNFLTSQTLIFTDHVRSTRKVMFSQMCVILFRGKGWGMVCPLLVLPGVDIS